MFGFLNHWMRSRRKCDIEPEATMAVPKEVRDASHALANASMRANFHIRRAERFLDPIDRILNDMRSDREK